LIFNETIITAPLVAYFSYRKDQYALAKASLHDSHIIPTQKTLK